MSRSDPGGRGSQVRSAAAAGTSDSAAGGAGVGEGGERRDAAAAGGSSGAGGKHLAVDLALLVSRLSLVDQITVGKMTSEKHSVDFSEPWTYSDIIFIVEGKKVYANKMILSMWSPVFEAMFHDDFREKTAREIELPGKSRRACVEMMEVLHPPNKDISNDNVLLILPLAQEYQMDKVTSRCEEFLCSQASSVKNYIIAQQYNLPELLESNLSYLKRAPVSRLKTQPDFRNLDHETLTELLMEKCEKFETHVEELREVRMVLERKKPTTFPGMHLLCEDCTAAREQQVDCGGCMKSCCRKITDILRNLER